MALIFGKHFYFLGFCNLHLCVQRKESIKCILHNTFFYQNKSTLFFAHFFQLRPVSKLIYLCCSVGLGSMFVNFKTFVKFSLNLFENYGRQGKCFSIITSCKKWQLWKGMHALFTSFLLVVANFGSHSHFHKAEALGPVHLKKWLTAEKFFQLF